MVVVHTLESLGNYMFTALIFWSVLIFIVLLGAFALLVYDCIYDYVSEQLDNCNYFGESNE